MTGALAIAVIIQITTPVVVDSLGEFRVAVQAAKPGAKIFLAPGRYEGGVFLSGIQGMPGRPITIGGADPANPPQIINGGTGIQLSGANHVVIQNLHIKGMRANGLNIDDGGNFERPASGITVSNIKVDDLPSGNHDGIKLSGLTGFTVENCSLNRWGGSGIDMVGCHNGVIRSCRFMSGGDNGVQAKGGTSNVKIISSTFVDSGQRGVNIGGSTALQFFRPPVTPTGPNAEARNISVEGCTFIRGVAPIAFVGVDGAKVAFNTIYLPGKWAIRILQETRSLGFVPSSNGSFESNLVVFDSKNWSECGINIGPGTAPNTFRFVANHWFCSDDERRSKPRLPTDEVTGVYGVDPNVRLGERGTDVMVLSKAIKAGAHLYRP